MSLRTINKKSGFVIPLILLSLFFSGCSPVASRTSPNPSSDRRSPDWAEPSTSGTVVSEEISESSGLAVSKCLDGVIWTHNDSGDDAFIYAIDATGRKLGTWKVVGARNTDWEDIASVRAPDGRCFLLIGDVGNNKLNRQELTIYRIPEPEAPDGGQSGRKQPRLTATAEMMRFEYPDARHNSESIFALPDGTVYVLTKSMTGPSRVYRLGAFEHGRLDAKAVFVAEITVPALPDGLLTGADVSADGRRVVVCDYFGAYEFVLPEKSAGFDEIWKVKPMAIELGAREIGEAIAYSPDGRILFASSENKGQPLIRVERLAGR